MRADLLAEHEAAEQQQDERHDEAIATASAIGRKRSAAKKAPNEATWRSVRSAVSRQTRGGEAERGRRSSRQSGTRSAACMP